MIQLAVEKGLNDLRIVLLYKIKEGVDVEDSKLYLYFLDNQTASDRLAGYYQGLGYVEHPLATMEIWQEKVSEGLTNDGYWTWVKECIETEAEELSDWASSLSKDQLL